MAKNSNKYASEGGFPRNNSPSPRIKSKAVEGYAPCEALRIWKVFEA